MGPSALVNGIMDGDDGAHVARGRRVAFAAHGFEEHVLGGVDPVASISVMAGVSLAVGGCGGCFGGVEGVSVVVGWEGAGDGGDFTGGAEG